MKKSIYFSLAVVGLLGLAACDEGDYQDWASPIVNAQDAAAETVGLTGSSVLTVDKYVDASTCTEDSVKVVDITLSSGYQAVYSLEFEGGSVVKLGAQGQAAVSDLEKVVVGKFGKAPQVRELTATLVAIVDVAGGAVKATVSNINLYIKPNAPVIYPHLYLIGAPSEWQPDCVDMPFTQSGKDVYEDPVFTITFPVETAGEIWFALADDYTVETKDWSNVFGCVEGDGANLIGEVGKLGRRSQIKEINPAVGDGSFMVSATDDDKFVKMTVNMLEGTYLIEKMNFAPYYYEIGAESGWSENHALFSVASDGIYQGYTYLDGEFKFKPNTDNWNNDLEYVEGSETSSTDEKRASEYTTGKVANIENGKNFPACTGFFELNLDLNTNTYKFFEVKSITMVGDFNGWNQADEATHMTYDKKEGCWTINYTFASKAKVKFAMNDNWEVSWGGADGDEMNYENLTQTSGKDLSVPAGEYTVKLYLSHEGTNHVVFDGEAAPVTGTGELYLTGSNYGWGSSCWIPMIPVNGTEDTFWRMIYLHADEQFKFAPYADWKEDFGFGAADVNDTMAGLCDEGGNFKATNAGWYLLKVVNPSSGKPSVTVMAPEVYLIGATINDSWTIDEAGKFEVPATDNGDFVSPAFTGAGDVRMCVTVAGAGDWWKSEFVGIDGKLEYRGNGDDQQRVSVAAGQKAYVNFTAGTVEYK